ncbi:hypothetical protein GCM10011514_20940 [Emticicia aquatilis]|uniref:Uncharacterized protein n=1 Tax=Emticicia aquatilis TaxID=1537369 RepID=A0A916YQQ3_9BACT|nr:hypothetical protein [Emticicia aquatilis]GGD56656.1 hypothetical protein GCM10011514_20940 [Emticicia aquatilis]
MKKIFSLLLFLIAFAPTFAQKLTDKQIEGYLDALQKEEIITEFGKDAFLKIVNKEDKVFNQRLGANSFGQFGKNQVPDSLIKSRTAILGFLGVFELMRNVGSAADELVRLRELSEKMLGDKMLFKTEIEGDIKLNNPLTFLVIEQNLRPSKANYTELAAKLKAINLIDEKVYNELLVWLKKDQIKLIKDFGFFVYAARQTYFYDNYVSLKATQFSLIDSLQHKKMLSINDANSIKNSYKEYELKSKVEILSYCKNVILIPAEQKNLTRSEIYESYWKEIKQKLIPNFDFKDIQLIEISKTEESKSQSESNIPIKNPFAGSQNKFKMTYQANGKTYTQKADTDFSLVKTIKKNLPPDIDIDSTIIQSYATAFSFLAGFTSKDFQSINDFLTDQHSSKRIIIVGNDYNPFLSVRDGRKAVLLVDSTQNVLFEDKNKTNPIFEGLFGTKADFSSKKSRDSLNSLIKEFQTIGLIPTTDALSIDNAIVELRFEPKNATNIKRNLLSQFPEVIAEVNPLPTKENEQIMMFKNFVGGLEKISRGAFKADKVSDNFETEIKKSPKKERELVVSFKVNGKKYESKNRIAKADDADETGNDKFSLNFSTLFFNTQDWLEEINRALEENQIDGKFYKINIRKAFTYGGTENYIFLTKKQSEYIEKKHSEILNDPEKPIVYGDYKQQVAAFNVENFTKALKREKMLAEDTAKDLKAAKEPSDILKESKQVVVIDMNELAEKSNTELYTYILQKLNEKLLPKAKFSEIKYLRDNTDSSETDFEKQNISALIDGKSYKQTLYVSLKHTIKSNLDSLKKENSNYFPSIGENQFKIVNDYLTDIASPYRLVIVCDYRSPKLSYVLFDSTQANIVEETLPNNYVDFTMYGTKYSRDSLSVLLDELTQIELIGKMSNQEKDDFIVNLRKFQINGLSVLENLKNITIQCNIWDVESYKDVYKSVIDSLSKISRNQFKPTLLTDNFAKTLKKSNYSDRTFTYGFTMPNGKKYEEKQFVKALPKPKNKQEKLTYELFDFDTAKLIDLVNRAVGENNTADGMFYPIYSEEDVEESIGPRFIFLNSKQYRWLKIKFPEIFETYDNEPENDIDERKEEK